MPPMVIWQAAKDALVTNAHEEHYRRSIGAGLVIVEATVVSPEGRLAATQIGAFDDGHIPGLARLAEIIHADDSPGGRRVAGIQIHHAGARTNSERNYGLAILAPSVSPDIPGMPLGAEELTEADIERIITDFADAARRVTEAGFDLVEIHGAHGYLGSQFLSPRTNRRRDGWGGSIENRSRFLIEAVSAVRAAVSPATAVTVRLGVAESEGGLTPEDGVRAAQLLEQAGVDALNISHGGSQPLHLIPSGGRWSATIELARRVKNAVGIPVIGVGDIRLPQEAEDALTEEVADLVAVARGILADPRWAQKAIGGQEGNISVCANCKPRCWHFTEPAKCPARRRLEQTR